MKNISDYADKEFKSSNSNYNNTQSYSNYTYMNIYNEPPFWLEKENGSYFQHKILMDYLLENFKSYIHYNSPDPEKLGVKAFTKNAEVYLAPGEGEETLKHELSHVIQQKKEKIPATTKIGEQQVNLDPKLEQEADEFAEHIEDHIPEIISNESINTETKDVIQCKLPSEDALENKIKEQAVKMGMTPNLIMDSDIKKPKHIIILGGNISDRGFIQVGLKII